MNKIFDQITVEERFTSLDKKWPQIFNTENLAISQPGGYEMRRDNNQSGNYIFPKLNKTFTSFELIYSLRFHNRASKSSSAGVLIMANEEEGTGILVETSYSRGYRISKSMSNGESFYYTNENGDGWIKNKKALGKKSNIIKIRTHEKKYDIFINDAFIYSFTEFEFYSGSIGVYIGPNSHCVLESFVVNTSSIHSNNSDSISVKNDINDINQLKIQLRMKQAEIDRLKAMQNNDQKNIAELKKLEDKITDLNERLNLQNNQIDSLQEVNQNLNYFKQSITLSNGEIAIDSLYSKLEQLKKDSALFEAKIAQYLNKNTEQVNEINALKQKHELLQKEYNMEIKFLLRQIDFITQKLKSDSLHLIDTIKNSQGFDYQKQIIPLFKFTEIKKA